MRYGRLLTPIAAAQVEIPEIGVNEFLDADTLLLSGKFPDGSVKPLATGAGGPLASQAVNTSSDENNLEFAVTGVVGYVEGDFYFLYITDANTAAVTIDINGLGAQDVKFLGNLNQDVPPGAIGGFVPNTVNAFVYTNARFEWLGEVQGDKVVLKGTIGFADAQGVAGGGASAVMNIINLPAQANLNLNLVRATIDTSGGASTKAEITAINVESAVDLFGAVVDTFTGAVAAGKGGLNNGIEFSGALPNQTGIQVYRYTWLITTDIWDNIVAGTIEVHAHWTMIPG